MATINIPSKVFPGFNLIADLNNDQISVITEYLKNISIENRLEEIADFFETNFNSHMANELTKTIFSFSELLESNEVDINDLAFRLANSFNEVAEKGMATEKLEVLRQNLYEILLSFQTLKTILKSRSLLYDNDSILHDFKVITDIRIIFNHDSVSEERPALILQKLHLEFTNNKMRKELFLSVDIDDLKKLKADIDRAIHEETIIREEYGKILKFIAN